MATKLLRSSLTRRLYHSTTHPPPPGPFTPLESRILRSAAPHIPTHGFTTTSLVRGATDAGYLAASTNLFPSGAFALVHWHLLVQREGLREVLVDREGEKEGWKGIGVGAKVKALTWERLMGNREVVGRWQEALALLAQPSNIPTATRELSLLADEIWYLAGDTSIDMSWYTKRASLSALYAATELFMTTDKSAGFADTREFLDRRFEDVRAVGKFFGDVGQWAGWTAGAAVNVLRSKGVRI